jgi:hypothetical protein
LLQRNVAHPGHRFWPIDITLDQALHLSHVIPRGHKQITDLYLLGLAIHRKGILATCDRSIATWESAGRSEKHYVEVIQ